MMLGVLLWMAACVPAAAQPSLADVARQEAARRKEMGTSTKVYTNKDVNRGRPLTTAAAVAKLPDPAGTPATEASGAAAPASAQGEGATAAAVASTDPQAAVRREQLARLTEAAALALGHADRLNATIVNLFDETQRRLATEERDRQLTDYRARLAEIEKINTLIGDPQQAETRAPAAAPPPPR